MIKVMWTILDAMGEVKGRRGGGAGSLYTTSAKAANHATKVGDSVVEVHIDLDVEPSFIRAKKVDPDGEA